MGSVPTYIIFGLHNVSGAESLRETETASLTILFRCIFYNAASMPSLMQSLSSMSVSRRCDIL